MYSLNKNETFEDFLLSTDKSIRNYLKIYKKQKNNNRQARY